MPIDIVGVISNHLDCQELVVNHDLPYHHIPVSHDTKIEAEARQMEIITAYKAELIVLARYMQVLSDQMCTKNVRPDYQYSPFISAQF